MSRVLGRSGIKVSEVGFGCWAARWPATGTRRPPAPAGPGRAAWSVPEMLVEERDDAAAGVSC